MVDAGSAKSTDKSHLTAPFTTLIVWPVMDMLKLGMDCIIVLKVASIVSRKLRRWISLFPPLVPCVAVIDEDSSFRTKELMWQAFRKAYPNRPFCLLVPNREIYGTVDLPGTFAQDNRTTFHYNVIRDDGDSALAQDWASFCGLNEYTAGNVDRVALFIDSTGSLKESQVSASRDKFIAQLNVSGIQVSRVYNKQENWIRPFMQSFVP
ncbi:Chromosome [Seminavis robusta]|uniref:Chromosome n=1 Tax=Seminavis robusta TaxID=568900 RepID=A0A9N8HAL5_9STRA|nr:Chromosome [Seminavis robusta]|eukprot:Sro153_g069620.1 Chromosome (208) ;mRNA; f:2373-3226